MKVLERLLEMRIRCQVSIDGNVYFGFMPGKGTTDSILIMRQVQEKHQAKKKKLYYAFVDVEKEFDIVPREVVRWAMRKLGVMSGSLLLLFATTRSVFKSVKVSVVEIAKRTN